MAQAALVLSMSGCRLLHCGRPPASSNLPKIALPGGTSGIGFDDLVFAGGIRRVLVPAGRTGKVFLLDPDSKAVSAIDGFSGSGIRAGGHQVVPTSADEGPQTLFVIDRTAKRLLLVNEPSKVVTAVAELASTPDYVRYASPRSEAWVTEPGAEQIEIFSAPRQGPPSLKHVATIPVAGGLAVRTALVSRHCGDGLRGSLRDGRRSRQRVDLRSRSRRTADLHRQPPSSRPVRPE